MTIRAPHLLATLVVFCLGSALIAQESGDPQDESAPKRHRAVSSGVAAALAAGRPKYDPPKPVEKKPEEDGVDMREIDKPRNQIIRLP
ncbi:MAG: hypothetical protein K9N01_16640, partial [Cephaloticoccus sp.]|nr:hypothetical protein [Cephaloticoccus sp.]